MMLLAVWLEHAKAAEQLQACILEQRALAVCLYLPKSGSLDQPCCTCAVHRLQHMTQPHKLLV